MTEKLYQKCEICGGEKCPNCNETGIWEVGLTVGQVDMIRENRDRLLMALWDLRSRLIVNTNSAAQGVGIITNAETHAAIDAADALLAGKAGYVEEARRRLGKGATQ